MGAQKSVGFVGCGRVATIFLGGWRRAGTMPGTIVAFDSNEEVTARLRNRYPDIRVGTLAEAAGQDIVFLAVHPPVVASVLPGVKPALKPEAILVSLAPKFVIAKLSKGLGGFGRIARVIPNAPSIIGKGYNPMAFGDALGEDDRTALRELLDGLGDGVEVSEAHLEVYAVVTAMGPTFLWPQLDMLASLARDSGLTQQAAWDGIEKMVNGTVTSMRHSGLSPADVQDLVPVRPVAEETEAFVGAAKPKLEGLLAKLRP